jgi:hypothetical protein
MFSISLDDAFLRTQQNESNLVCCYFLMVAIKTPEKGEEEYVKGINTFMILIRDLYHHIVAIHDAFKDSLCSLCARKIFRSVESFQIYIIKL